jgi:hypothetical protein
MSDSIEGVSSSAPSDGTSVPSPASTPAPSPDHAGSGPAAQDAPTASPSDARPDDHAALLGVVRQVTRPENSGSEGRSVNPNQGPATGTPPAASPASPDPLDIDPSAQELEGFTPPTRKRVERLLQQRNQARVEIERLKEPAAKWEQLFGYLSQHKLAPEDVNLLLGIGAHMRAGNWRAVRDGMAPYWQLANEALGDVLPQDLQARVSSGEVTQEMAAEMSRMRHQNIRLNGIRQASEQEATQAASQQNAQAVNNAVTAWEQQIIQRDPDYARKAGAVLRSSQALMSQHQGTMTPADAVRIAQQAYDEVNGWTGQWRPPQTQPIRPGPQGTRVVNGARPEPRNLMEAAILGLQRSRATTH